MKVSKNVGAAQLDNVGGRKSATGTSPEKVFKPDFKPTFKVDPRAAKLNDEGFAAIKGGDYLEALEMFEQSNRVQPNPDAFNRMSVALTHLGRFDEARGAITKALELEPGYPKALYNLAVDHARRGEFDEALKTFEKGVFPNGKGFIDGAKGDSDLDGLRPAGERLSKDGYNFKLKAATPAQLARFASLVSGEKPSGPSDAIAPPARKTTFSETGAASASAAPVPQKNIWET